MKTWRPFFAVILLVFLTAGISVAQGNKQVVTKTIPVQGLLPCTDEYIVGEEIFVYTYWDGRSQMRGKATFTGASGKIYTWSLLENFSHKYFTEGTANNLMLIATSVLECEGIPIAVYKIRYHLTFNANGEPTAEFERGFDGWICL